MHAASFESVTSPPKNAGRSTLYNLTITKYRPNLNRDIVDDGLCTYIQLLGLLSIV